MTPPRPRRIINGVIHYLCRGKCAAWLPETKFHRVGNSDTRCDRRARCIMCEKERQAVCAGE